MKLRLLGAIAVIVLPTLALAQVSAGAGGTNGGAGGAKEGTTGPGIQGTRDSSPPVTSSSSKGPQGPSAVGNNDNNGGASANGSPRTEAGSGQASSQDKSP